MSSVELYVELLPTAPSLAAASSVRVASPCTPEAHEHAPAAIPATSGLDADQGGADPTDAESLGGVDPAESAAKSFRTAAARVIMKVMYAAIMARPDLLRSIAYQARCLTKRTQDQGKTLHRLIAYINNSLGYRMYAWSEAGDRAILLYFGCSPMPIPLAAIRPRGRLRVQ